MGGGGVYDAHTRDSPPSRTQPDPTPLTDAVHVKEEVVHWWQGAVMGDGQGGEGVPLHKPTVEERDALQQRTERGRGMGSHNVTWSAYHTHAGRAHGATGTMREEATA